MNKNKLESIYQKHQQILGHQGPIYALSQDAAFYYSASSDKYVARWHKATGQQDTFAVRCTEAPFSILVVEGLNLLVLGLANGHLHLIHTEQRKEIKHLTLHQAAVFALAYNPWTKHFYTADADGLLCIWDQSWTLLLQQPLACGKIRHIEVNTDGSTFFLACADGMVRQIDAVFFNEIQQFQAHSEACTTLSVLPNGQFLSGGKDGYVRRWAANGTKIAAFPAHLGTIYQLKQLDASCYATVSRDKTIKIWQLLDDQIAQRIDMQMASHRHSINALLITNNGFLTAGDDKRIIEWRRS